MNTVFTIDDLKKLKYREVCRFGRTSVLIDCYLEKGLYIVESKGCTIGSIVLSKTDDSGNSFYTHKGVIWSWRNKALIYGYSISTISSQIKNICKKLKLNYRKV